MPLRTPALDRARRAAEVAAEVADSATRRPAFEAAKGQLNDALRRHREPAFEPERPRDEDGKFAATGQGLDQGSRGGDPPPMKDGGPSVSDRMRIQLGILPPED